MKFADALSRRSLIATLGIASATGPSLAASDPAARYAVEIRKSERQLTLRKDGAVSHAFRIGLGFAPEGPKQRQGDGRTPEGEFRTILKNPQSSFYKSVMLDYPLPADALRGFKDGLVNDRVRDAILGAHRRGTIPPQGTRLGGEIFIHGGGNRGDWTLGCVALENRDMDVIFALPVGVRVAILA